MKLAAYSSSLALLLLVAACSSMQVSKTGDSDQADRKGGGSLEGHALTQRVPAASDLDARWACNALCREYVSAQGRRMVYTSLIGIGQTEDEAMNNLKQNCSEGDRGLFAQVADTAVTLDEDNNTPAKPSEPFSGIPFSSKWCRKIE